MNRKQRNSDINAEDSLFSFCEYMLSDSSIQDCHSALEITLFKCSGVYVINGKRYEFDENSIFLIPANVPHSIPEITKQGVFYNIRFEPRFIWGTASTFDRKYLEVFLCADTNFMPKLNKANPIHGTLVDLIEMMYEEFSKKEPGFEQMSKALLMMRLTHIYRHYTYEVDMKSVIKPEIASAVEKAVEYIDEHFAEKITLSEIAKAANLSLSYFGVVFKKLNGVTPWEYITSKRVKKAIDIIRVDGYSTIMELAETCGFDNVSNFNRMFKKYTGVVPSRYVNNDFVLKKESLVDF